MDGLCIKPEKVDKCLQPVDMIILIIYLVLIVITQLQAKNQAEHLK